MQIWDRLARLFCQFAVLKVTKNNSGAADAAICASLNGCGTLRQAARSRPSVRHRRVSNLRGDARPRMGPHAAFSSGREILDRLALQLLFLRASESMGNHDSKIVDAGSVD